MNHIQPTYLIRACLGIVFILVFLSTLNAAHLNGDDVVYMVERGRDVLLFRPYQSWLTNRVVGMYGATLGTHLFDFVFFPLNTVFGADFFWVYKWFWSFVFSVFVALVYRYILKNMFFYKRERICTAYEWIVSLFIGLVLLILLGWKNHTHFFFYQLPAVITFIAMNVLYSVLINSNQQTKQKLESSYGYLVLFYLAAFSLEPYTLILLLCTGGLLFYKWIIKREIIKKRDSLEWEKGEYLAALAIVFCILSLLVGLWSERLAVTKIGALDVEAVLKSIFKESSFFDLMWSGGIFLMLFVIWVGWGTKKIYVYFLERFINQEQVVETKPPYFLKGEGGWLLGIWGTSLFVVGIVSWRTGMNYFSHLTYPWGDLLLVTKLVTLLVFGKLMWRGGSNRSWLWKSSVVFLLVLIMSKHVFWYIDQAKVNADISQKVEKAYREALQVRQGVVETGLHIKSMEDPIHPFPVDVSMQWTKDDYQALFLKYYGVKISVVFE